MDAKATVKVGPFARGGKSRVPTKAADHDFQPAATVTPVGMLLPASNELFLYGVTSQVGSRLSGRSVGRLVGERQRALCPHHDPAHQPGQWAGEPQSTHGSLMQRLVEFAQRSHLTIRLVYYPPYHSKYNPIERGFGILEQHWNGALLDSLEAVMEVMPAL
jgi:Rhodopirellula transposase DDE domain